MLRIYTALRRKMFILRCKVAHFFTRNKIHVLFHNSGRQCRMYWHKSRGILSRQANGDHHQTTSEFRDHRQQNCVEKAQSPWNKRKSYRNHVYVPWFRLDRRFTDVHGENTIFSKAITHCHCCLRWLTHTQRVVMEVAHQILTRIWALSTSASCLRASISFWLWLWLCCCIFVLIFWSNLRRKLLGKWPQSSANACCRSQSGETPLIQHCSKPRNRINWLNGANERSFFANYFCNIQEKLSLQTLGVVPFRRIAKKGGDPAKLAGPSLILSLTARRHGQFQFAFVFSRAFSLHFSISLFFLPFASLTL